MSAAPGVLAALVLLCGCTERQRPSPVDPGGGMTVGITAPTEGQTFNPGAILIVVHGHDTIGRMTALGVQARSPALSAGYADSVIVTFSEVADTSLTLSLNLPNVTQPTGVELYAVARNSAGGEVTSGTRAVIVIPCAGGVCH